MTIAWVKQQPKNHPIFSLGPMVGARCFKPTLQSQQDANGTIRINSTSTLSSASHVFENVCQKEADHHE